MFNAGFGEDLLAEAFDVVVEYSGPSLTHEGAVQPRLRKVWAMRVSILRCIVDPDDVRRFRPGAISFDGCSIGRFICRGWGYAVKMRYDEWSDGGLGVLATLPYVALDAYVVMNHLHSIIVFDGLRWDGVDGHGESGAILAVGAVF